MSFAPHRAAQAYASVGLETGVPSADPHRLILMLFEAAQVAIADARRYMQLGEIGRKCEAVSKAVRIIDEGLSASLDIGSGGALARSLAELYAYMTRRLLLANARNQPELLDEVRVLLGELKDAWAAIPPQPATPSARPAAATMQRPY